MVPVIFSVLSIQVGKGSGNPYKYPDITAGYVVKWITGAKKEYNLTIDYVGVRRDLAILSHWYLAILFSLVRFGMKGTMILNTSRQVCCSILIVDLILNLFIRL